MKRMLIVDDEDGARKSLEAIFKDQYNVFLAENGDRALNTLALETIDILLLDVIMPGRDGISVLKSVQTLYPEIPVIMVSASTSVKPVVEAIKMGAVDYVTKPFEVEAIRIAVQRALENNQLHRRVEVLEQDIHRAYPTNGIIGSSAALQRSLREAGKAAETSASVLITGESGTGKELVARLIHDMSGRKAEPFVAVHCGALPETLMETELFGHEKGAFTGADKRKLGRFDLAGSGTLFFDEVTEMTQSTQVKLLRVLQEKEFMRVGGVKEVKTDARIIAACNRNIMTHIENDKFREDLYYRLSVVPIHLPPLRDRTGDIPLLAQYFLDYFQQSMDVATKEFAPETLRIMQQYTWPGNIRELKNIVERMLVLYGDCYTITSEFLPEEFHHHAPRRMTSTVGEINLEEAVNAYEKELVERALRDAEGIQTRAAEILGTTRRILKYRMEKLNIQMAKAGRA